MFCVLVSNHFTEKHLTVLNIKKLLDTLFNVKQLLPDITLFIGGNLQK